MNNKSLLGALAAVLVISAACGSSNTNNSNANKAAASPTPSAAASPKPSVASTEAGKGFTLVNSTGVDIHALYITPSDSKDWQDDILGRDTLPDGERTDIKFERNEKAAMWDMRIEDEKGGYVEWHDLKLLELKRVTLLYKNGQPTADTE